MYFGRASSELRAAAVRAPGSHFGSAHFLTCRHDQTGLSYTQVATWFINARKRVWKPLVHDQNSNDVGSTMDVDNSVHALSDRSQVYIVMPDPHDDYQGLGLFSPCSVSSPCVSPLQGNRLSQSMQPFHISTIPS